MLIYARNCLLIYVRQSYPTKLFRASIYGVDSGAGGFLDAEVVKVLQDQDDEAHDNLIETLLEARMSAPGAIINIADTAASNFVAFTSGVGDGTYPSYWGYDSARNVVCLVTDFGLFTE